MFLLKLILFYCLQTFFPIFTVKNSTKFGCMVYLSCSAFIGPFLTSLFFIDMTEGIVTHMGMCLWLFTEESPTSSWIKSLHGPLQHFLLPEHFIVSNFVLITVLLSLEVLISWYTKNDIVFASNVVLLYFSSVTIFSYNHCVLR